MPLQSSQIPASSAEDEIDLRELCGLLLRQRIWLILFTLLGFAWGGVLATTQINASKICLIINTSESPDRRKVEVNDIDTVANSRVLGKSIFLVQPTKPSLDEVIYALQRILEGLGKSITDLEIAPLRVNNVQSQTQVSMCGTVRSISEARKMRNLLKRVEALYKQQIYGSNRDVLSEYSPSWILFSEGSIQNVPKNRLLAIWGIGGLMVGSIAALIADRRLNRVFSHDKLLGLLSYPLIAKLPSWPWDHPGAQTEIAQLAMKLDPALSWLVFSIGKEHPMIEHLVDALYFYSLNVCLQHMPPLLMAPVKPPDHLRPVGVLIVVERGFNSAEALKESRRVLASLSFVHEVGVILIGIPLPTELTM